MTIIMADILVAGLINIETTVRVDGFPIDYTPVRYPFHAVNSSVSGVGYNIAKALTVLGDDIRFLSLIGEDHNATLIQQALDADSISSEYVLTTLPDTAQSVILYDGDGRRMINVDLKDIQEHVYPLARFEDAIHGCDLAVLCNINFTRAMLPIARQRGIPIATDVHAISQPDDDYNQDYMAQATILFQSDEHLPCSPEDWAALMLARYAGIEILVIGLGAQGALLAVRRDDYMARFPAQLLRPVVNTIGAGDALFSAFVHAYHRVADPYRAIRRAIIFAGYKVGVSGAADGLMSAGALQAAYQQIYDED